MEGNSAYPTSEPAAKNYATGQASTAEQTIGINAYQVDDYASIINLIQSLPANFDNGFQIRTVTLKEVIHELWKILSDCSTGPDNIPGNMIKMVAVYPGSPLTDVKLYEMT